MRTHLLKASVFLAGMSVSSGAFAIRGEYLPESELPKNVCRIVIGKLQYVMQPSTRTGRAMPEWKPVILESRDQFVCSANLVAPDLILTAAHCFQGNNEWKVRKGIFKYPKLDQNGNRLPGCEGNDYMQKEKCVEGDAYGTMTTKWIDTRVECPRDNAPGFEARPLKENLGYSNPFYTGNAPENRHTTSISIANFDFAFYRLESPITTTKPMEVVWDFREIDQMLKSSDLDDPNPMKQLDQCRSFGYGTDNDEKYGTLRGANTPVSRAAPSYVESGLDARFPLPNVGWVDHGDSGGALMCRGKNDRRYRLVGIVSRGLNQSDIERSFEEGSMGGLDPEEADEISHLIAKSDYSLPSFNRLFFDYTMKNGSFPRSLDKHSWWQLFAPYTRQQIHQEMSDTRACIETSRREMTRSTYRDYDRELGNIEGLLASIEKEARGYGGDPGYFLAKIQSEQVLQKNRDLLWHCQGKVFFRDR